MKRTRIASRSAKRNAQQRRRLASWVPGETLCAVRVAETCTGLSEGLHERRKASSAGTREPGENTIPCCNMCNGFVEDEPDLARSMVSTDGRTLVVREGDEEWEELGSRHDR